MELRDQLASFKESVDELQAAVSDIETTSTGPTSVPASLDVEQISQLSKLLPTQFQEIIAGLSDGQLNPTVEQQISTYQTEAHRRLRLIGIEAMRLRTARQPANISRVCAQLSEHLTQLQQFVQAMQAAVSEQKG